MTDASEIKHAEELLQLHLVEWRDAGGHIESVTGAILRLIVARERFAEAVRAEKETSPAPESPETTWDCSICGRSNYVTVTHCEHCEYSRMVLHAGRLVPRDGYR